MSTFRGEYERSSAYARLTAESAARRGDVQFLLFAACAQLKNHLWSGVDFMADIAETERLLPLNEGYRPTQIEGYGLLAWAYLRLGQTETAKKMALIVLEQTRGIYPQAYYCVWGITGAGVTFMSLYEMAGDSELLANAHDLCSALNKSGMYSVGRPGKYLLTAWYEQLNHRSTRAKKLFEQSIQAARQLQMPYEEGLAHLHLARLTPLSAAEKSAHLQEAVGIFERIGARWDRDFACSLMSPG